MVARTAAPESRRDRQSAIKPVRHSAAYARARTSSSAALRATAGHAARKATGPVMPLWGATHAASETSACRNLNWSGLGIVRTPRGLGPVGATRRSAADLGRSRLLRAAAALEPG